MSEENQITTNFDTSPVNSVRKFNNYHVSRSTSSDSLPDAKATHFWPELLLRVKNIVSLYKSECKNHERDIYF